MKSSKLSSIQIIGYCKSTKILCFSQLNDDKFLTSLHNNTKVKNRGLKHFNNTSFNKFDKINKVLFITVFATEILAVANHIIQGGE